MNQRHAPSDEAISCFVHGVGHMIDELGSDTGLETAAELVRLLQGRTLLADDSREVRSSFDEDYDMSALLSEEVRQ